VPRTSSGVGVLALVRRSSMNWSQRC